MFGEMLDTSPEGRRFYFQRLAQLSPAQRMALMAKTTALARRMAEAGIRRDHPDLTDEELRLHLAARLYGRATAERILGRAIRDDR